MRLTLLFILLRLKETRSLTLFHVLPTTGSIGQANIYSKTLSLQHLIHLDKLHKKQHKSLVLRFILIRIFMRILTLIMQREQMQKARKTFVQFLIGLQKLLSPSTLLIMRINQYLSAQTVTARQQHILQRMTTTNFLLLLLVLLLIFVILLNQATMQKHSQRMITEPFSISEITHSLNLEQTSLKFLTVL